MYVIWEMVSGRNIDQTFAFSIWYFSPVSQLCFTCWTLSTNDGNEYVEQLVARGSDKLHSHIATNNLLYFMSMAFN